MISESISHTLERAEHEATAVLIGIDGLKADPENEELRKLTADTCRKLARLLEGDGSPHNHQPC